MYYMYTMYVDATVITNLNWYVPSQLLRKLSTVMKILQYENSQLIFNCDFLLSTVTVNC